ncbi:glycoside hydrolase family 13 protein [Nocardioidaceae bacterium]|nr:glycoside hydrolase family 13 protein [Nocardioidaceae bacterium]
MTDSSAATRTPRTAPGTAPWWRDAVIYQVYVRSFADADGDGLGDLPGITSRLGHLAELGVDALWITPFYTSPQHDHGYDVADYRDVDPRFGSLEDFDALRERAHELGLKVIVDVVPNHTSSDHVWFQAALEAGPGSPERARYIFRDGLGEDGSQPPNNWQSVFGGDAWTRVEDGQWYLHIFDTSQPDLDWTHPEVGDEFDSVLRFWLDRGVDGFRVDVAHGLVKAEGLPSTDEQERQYMIEGVNKGPFWDQDGVHQIWRRWRAVLDEYDDRMMVAEAWAPDAERLALYVRPDEYHQAFNFHFLGGTWGAGEFRRIIEETYRAVEPVGAAPTWVLSNHDVVRHPTRFGAGSEGLARARALTATILALPGSTYLYQGEELGLEEVVVPKEDREDPAFHRGQNEGRDGCRVPIPWSGAEPPFGFGPGEGQPWLPQPTDWDSMSVEAQTGEKDSTLEFYREALRVRREQLDLDTSVELDDPTEQGTAVLSFTRGDVHVLLNTGTDAVDLPDGDVLLSSGPLDDGMLPADTVVWLRR